VDEREVLARHRASHRAFQGLFASGSPGAELVEHDGGVLALRCPARPERSLVNAVVYDDPVALAAALPALGRWYDAAGIRAWTVWVKVGDEAAARACAEAGHVLDARPELMWAPLAGLDLDAPAPDGVRLDPAPGWKALGDVNDAAYGLPSDHLSITLHGADPDACLRTAAWVGGEAVACAVVNHVGDDAHVSLVATLPSHRRAGLAAACMRAGLRRARDAGATSTTLEATQAGRPVYARMGYRALGPLGMWERRR
jgi:GNAT superfamily N-acetyltransferase